MSLQDAHVPAERLTLLALGPADADNHEDRAALLHTAKCLACGDELARLTTELGTLRLEAAREADAHFDDVTLDMQRSRILDRLAHLGQSARVLRFPGAAANRSAQTGAVSRRWISAAAAAGLLIGIVTGQLLHVMPADRARHAAAASTVEQVTARAVTPAVVQAAAMTVSDEDLLGEIDVAVQRRRATELLALDALTPTVSESR
ncbi:MAG: hypothetical protein ABR606_19265 [Vicinamibacterales bacterium]